LSKLYILSGPERGKSFALKGDVVHVGRSPESDIQINERHISRKHLKIARKGSKFLIEDLGSANGTFLRGTVLEVGKEYEVSEGVPICIGNVFFSLGKVDSRDISAYLSSIDPSDGLNETLVIDRPMTAYKNLELIYKVSNVLTHSSDLNETLAGVLDYIFDILKRIDRAAIILVDSETGKISKVISRSRQEVKDRSMVYSRSVVKRVIKERKAVVMSDTRNEDGVSRSESMELMKIRSVMCVPLISKSRARGAIYVDSINKPYGFRKDDLILLAALSSPAAVAIENSMLYADLEGVIDAKSRTLVETERKFRETQERSKAIFDNMSSGVVVYDVVNDGEDFVILDLNVSARKLDNLKKRAAVGKSVLEVFPWVKETGLLEAFRRVFKSNKPEHQTVTLYEDDKPVNWREYYLYNLPSGEIVSIFDDVTDSKRAEEEQKALQEQLLVSQKMESIGGFAGGTAHNFRNILQAISGNIEYLEMLYGKNPEVKELAASIYDSVEKGVDLINSLLYFSKRGGQYQAVDLNLTEVIMNTYEIIERVFDKKIEIKLDLEEDLFVRGNQSLLSQVFMNLVTNARDAMPDGGTLRIEAKKMGNKVVTTVSDTGCGMDKETQERVFDPFFTLKDVGKGTGLGLSTSLGIVEEHKGSISVSSKIGKGSTFKVYLPYVKKTYPEKVMPLKELRYGRGEKVLVVDDEKPALVALDNLVKGLGYQTIPCESPKEAVKNYKKWEPDVVIMDRSMPELNGATCIRQIMKKDPSARIIIISGYDETGPDGIDEDVRGLIKGYITKPCKIEELGEMISRVLEK
jgi:signal transduction histidine kinase